MSLELRPSTIPSIFGTKPIIIYKASALEILEPASRKKISCRQLKLLFHLVYLGCKVFRENVSTRIPCRTDDPAKPKRSLAMNVDYYQSTPWREAPITTGFEMGVSTFQQEYFMYGI
jgi:hypothetical protein